MENKGAETEGKDFDIVIDNEEFNKMIGLLINPKISNTKISKLKLYYINL